MVVDTYLVYSFVKRLVTPFDSFPAYTANLIDADGNFKKDRKKFSALERKALPLFDVMIINLKKLIAKLPGGKTKIGTIAAALMLLRAKPAKKYVNEETEITDMLFNLEEDFERAMIEVEAILEDAAPAAVPVNNTSGVAGFTPSTIGVPVAAANKYKMKNVKDSKLLLALLKRKPEI